MSSQSITRRQFITRAGVAALALPLIDLRAQAAGSERPNFVFILTDDQRYDAMSCAGHPFLRTPNIDRIAKEGVRFTNAFVTISLCAPSRGCFHTGRYAHSHGVKDNKTQLSDDMPTFLQILQKQGYDTAFIGKWHMDGQEGPRPGINRWVSFKGQGEYIDPMLNIDGEKLKVTGYMTDLLTGYALTWLKQPRNTPFCLCLWHKAVHGPFTPAVRHSKLYSDVEIKRPASSSEDMSGRPEWFAKRQETRPDRMTDERYANFILNYNRTIVGIDDSVGRVLSTLEGMGALENTVIVFAGDNGYFQGEHGMLDKRAAYEESIRIPLLMRYPKLIEAGSIADPMVLGIDICPTFLDLAGAPIPNGVQGRPLRPVLAGKPSNWRRDFLYEYFYETPFITPTIRAVRAERWKYVEYPDNADFFELYDLRGDRQELKNLAGDTGHAPVLASMRARLAELVDETK